MITEQKDIRWIQRFANFSKALQNLDEFLKKGKLNKLEEQGLVKAFEYTYELAWNTLKDYLEYQGHTDITGSRDTTQAAFKAGLIEDGETWMDMLASRNKTSHTYNQETAREITTAVVTKYAPLFQILFKKMGALRIALLTSTKESV